MNDITKKVLSGMSGDGFNERKGYINRNNDLNRMNSNTHYDESLARMRVSENRPDIETVKVESKLESNAASDTSTLKRNIDMYHNFNKQGINTNINFKKSNNLR